MSAVAECLSKLQLGPPQPHGGLALFPLLGDGIADPAYLLLDEALAEGCAQVTEVSESGSVPELRFVNGCTRPVLLLDGEELVGAKQNRILNLTVLAPALETILIPVSCVEAGRWSAHSARFASAGRAHYAAGRARKASQVSDALRSEGSRRSDQGEVWADIAAKSVRMGVSSDTDAAAALYADHRASLDGYREAFTPVPAQLGALFLLNGRVLSLDIFDSARTLAALLPKLVESAALDALDAAGGEPDAPSAGQAEAFIAAVTEAELEGFPAVGMGEDHRLRSPRAAGGALLVDGRLIHLCAFGVDMSAPGSGPSGSRIVRASRRHRARG